MTRQIVILSALIGFTNCGTARLSEKEAIELAENYILEQSYSNKEIAIDSTIIQPDFVEKDLIRAGIIELRHNSLRPKAVFHRKGMTKWTVGFQTIKDSTRFRLVQFSRKGKNIRMVHQELRLHH